METKKTSHQSPPLSTFEKVSSDWLKTKLGMRAYGWYVDQTRILDEAFEGRLIATITTTELKAFATERRNDRKKSTINRSITVLKMIFKYAGKMNYVPRGKYGEVLDPADDDEFKTEKREGDRVNMHMKPEEFNRLLQQSPEWLRPVLITATFSGGRKCEVLGPTPVDIDFEENEVKFRWTKRHDEDRVVKMPKRLRGTLKQVLDDHPDRESETTPLFLREDGRPVTAEMIRKPFADAVRKAKLYRVVSTEDRRRVKEYFHFYDLRHTCASWLLNEGVQIEVIQEVLGHGDLRITQKYAKVGAASKAAAATALDEAASELCTTRTPQRFRSAS